MKIAVFSDTHSNTALMLEAVQRYRPDAVIHLGDHDRDALELKESFPELPLYSVCGNCDLMPLAPAASLITLGELKAFITHGHLYNVDFGRVDTLVYAAQEQGAAIALYGHTHRALYKVVDGVAVLNPGTAGKGASPTWAMLTIDGSDISAEIKEL